MTQTKQETYTPSTEFSISERNGLSFLRGTDLVVFSPGISTAGAVEIEMVMRDKARTVIGTTIDEEGYEKTKDLFNNLGYGTQVDLRVSLEDLRDGCNFPDNNFDFIYSRLVLHYLSAEDLDFALSEFYRILKPGGRLFVVVRSEKNIPLCGLEHSYNPETKLTTIFHLSGYDEVRYFHSPDSITEHLVKAGFEVEDVDEYEEALFKDYERKIPSDNPYDHLIEVRASKVEEPSK